MVDTVDPYTRSALDYATQHGHRKWVVGYL